MSIYFVYVQRTPGARWEADATYEGDDARFKAEKLKAHYFSYGLGVKVRCSDGSMEPMAGQEATND